MGVFYKTIPICRDTKKGYVTISRATSRQTIVISTCIASTVSSCYSYSDLFPWLLLIRRL